MTAELTTAVAAYQRVMSVWFGLQAGAKRFLYAGPEDSRNRPFCAERVNKSFSIAEIDGWDNQQGIPANVYLGGYGCRHWLVPVKGGND